MQHILLYAQNICTMFGTLIVPSQEMLIFKAALHANALHQLLCLDHQLRKTVFESLHISHLNSVHFCWCCKARILHISRPLFLQSLEALLWLLLAQVAFCILAKDCWSIIKGNIIQQICLLIALLFKKVCSGFSLIPLPSKILLLQPYSLLA